MLHVRGFLHKTIHMKETDISATKLLCETHTESKKKSQRKSGDDLTERVCSQYMCMNAGIETAI